MATPWPSPVDPRRSRANKLSNTRLLATPWLFSNSRPACSNMRFLLVTSRSRRMFDGGRSFAIRFIEGLEVACVLGHRAGACKGVEFYTIAPTGCCARCAGSKGFPHAHRRNLQGLSVLGDGTARDHDALLTQNLRDLAVRQGSLAVFRGDELLDQRADRRGGASAPCLRGDVTSKKILELENSAGRKHELLRRHARNRGFVQAQSICDLAQHQRPHPDLAVLEEVPLPVDDGLRHAQDGLEPLLDVLDQPARLLQLV